MHKIVRYITFFISIVIVPFQLASHVVFGMLYKATFGLIAWLMETIWKCIFFTPMIALSRLIERNRVFRPFLALPGILLATLGYIYASLVPPPGKTEEPNTREMLCQAFPFSWEFYRTARQKTGLDMEADFIALVHQEP